MAPGAAPAVAAVVVLQPLHQRLARRGLQPRVERRAHVVAALGQLGPKRQQRALAHLFDEIVGVVIARAGRRHLDHQVFLHRRLGLGAGDPAHLRHLAQHPVAPAHGRDLVVHGVVVVRSLGQGRQIGALRQIELGERLAEIVVGGGADAIGAVAQPDLVQIELEDALLGQGLLDALGEDGFLELAAKGLVAGQKDVLGHLLGDGRAALEPAPLRHVEDVLAHGPRHAGRVDAAVLEEIMILGRQEGVHHLLGDLVVGHEDAAFLGELADQGAVPGIDPRRRGRTIVHQFRRVGHVVEQPRRIDRQRKSRDGDQAQHHYAGRRDPSRRELQNRRPPRDAMAPAPVFALACVEELAKAPTRPAAADFSARPAGSAG